MKTFIVKTTVRDPSTCVVMRLAIVEGRDVAHALQIMEASGVSGQTRFVVIDELAADEEALLAGSATMPVRTLYES